MKTILNAHPAVELTGELPFLAGELRTPAPNLAGRLRRADVYGNLRAPDPGEEHLSGDPSDVVMRMLPVTKAGVRWIGSKTPQFAEDIDVLFTFLPHARLILVVRDVRDVALSWRTKWGKSALGCAVK